LAVHNGRNNVTFDLAVGVGGHGERATRNDRGTFEIFSRRRQEARQMFFEQQVKIG